LERRWPARPACAAAVWLGAVAPCAARAHPAEAEGGCRRCHGRPHPPCRASFSFACGRPRSRPTSGKREGLSSGRVPVVRLPTDPRLGRRRGGPDSRLSRCPSQAANLPGCLPCAAVRRPRQGARAPLSDEAKPGRPVLATRLVALAHWWPIGGQSLILGDLGWPLGGHLTIGFTSSRCFGFRRPSVDLGLPFFVTEVRVSPHQP